MKLQITKKHIAHWALRLLTVLASVIIGLFLVLQLPWVQNKIIEKILGRFQQASGFQITSKKLYLSWFDQLEISDMSVTDDQKTQLLSVSNITIDYHFLDIFSNGNINLDELTVNQMQLNMVYQISADSTRSLNLVRLINQLSQFFSSSQPKPGNGTPIIIQSIQINNSLVKIHDPLQTGGSTSFNPSDFSLNINSAEFSGFEVRSDTIQVQANRLTAQINKNQIPVHQGKFFFRFFQKGMEFRKAKIEIGNSILRDQFIFQFSQPVDLADFITKVNLKINLKESILDPEDLAYFTGMRAVPKQPVQLSGLVTGKVNNLNVKQFTAVIGQTSIHGDLMLDGLPVLDETFIQASVEHSKLRFNDLNFLIPPRVVERLKALGVVKVKGEFTGFINDFVANAGFYSTIGEIDSDVNLKIDPQNFEQSTYSGNLSMKNFDLGKFLSDTARFQKVTMTGNIRGKGLSLTTADFNLKGTVSSVGVLGYEYNNLISNARFSNNLFSGDLSIDDENLKVRLSGTVDLRNQLDAVQLKASIDTAALQPMKLSKLPISLKTDIEINTTGLTLDKLRGSARFKNIRLTNELKQLNTDSISISSVHNQEFRQFRIASSLGNLELKGNFDYENLTKDLKNIFHEFYLNFKNDQAAIQKYYSLKQERDHNYRADFLIRFQDLNPVFRFIDLDATVSKRIQISGHFVHGFTTIFHAFTAIPKITWNDQVFQNNEFDFNGSKIQDSTSVLAMLLISSEKQKISKSIETRDLVAEGIWYKDHIDVGLDFDQVGFDNSFRIKSEIDFLPEQTRVAISPSKIRMLGKNWIIDPKNNIIIKGDEFEFKNVSLAFEQRSMSISGKLSQNPDEKLDIRLKDMTLDLVNSLIGEKLDGILNGEMEIKNLYNNASVQNSLHIDGFKVNDFLVGDVTGTNNWDADLDAFIINFFVDRLQRRMIDLTGLYTPDDPESPLRLTANLNQAQLKIIEPIFRDIFSNWGGAASGSLDISGTFSKPLLTGKVFINEGLVTINFLNTTYRINGQLQSFHDRIDFIDFILKDAYANTATLNGNLQHREFSDFQLNLKGSFKNFQAMNTTVKNNPMFYGQAYATGTMNFSGPVNNLRISATARTDRNTKIYIPINSTGSVERGEFIRFINLKDTVDKEEDDAVAVRKVKSNFSVNLNLDITPDAYTEIIFDIKAGDIIRGWGKGDLKIDMDTQGDFSMFGIYEFDRGFYNFTLGGVINKEFTINKGSKITWYGDPYTANLSINAAYRQLASLAPILFTATDSNPVPPSLRRKFPIEVSLALEGPMLSPQINFDINARDLPENLPSDGNSSPIPVKFQFNAFKSRLDEQELKKQVFSLIVLRKFSPPDAFTTSGGIANSVSEFLSNQLSYWLSQVDQNLEVSLDLGSLDQDAFNISQLRMSYSLMNGRLRITRDGTLFSNQYTQSNVAALAGDWTVDYLLTADGKFKIKMYSRSNYNALLSSINTQTAYTTGLSLSHTQSFNRFSELLQRSYKKRRQEVQQNALKPEEE